MENVLCTHSKDLVCTKNFGQTKKFHYITAILLLFSIIFYETKSTIKKEWIG